jgi:membrane-bound lytic murein transglycosylase D
VRRDVQRAGTRDFWELRRRGVLPRETREFVPRFYGLVQALRNYPAGESPPLQELYRWRRITVPDGVELRQLGQLGGVPGEVLEQANAELRYGLTPTARGSASYLMKVPADAYDRLVAVLEDSAGVLVRLHRHTVRSGDTMSELAAAFEVSVALIRHYNAGVDPRRMAVGVGLRIPLVRGVDPAAVQFPELRETRAFEADYRVAGGDSLWRIARLHDTTVEALASANGLQPTSILHPGQLLQVPRRGEPPAGAGRA